MEIAHKAIRLRFCILESITRRSGLCKSVSCVTRMLEFFVAVCLG